MVWNGQESIGRKIRQAREERGLTTLELSRQAGCSDEYLEWIEEGQVEPPVALLLQLAKALKLDSVAFLHAQDLTAQRMEEEAKRTDHYSYQTLTPSEPDKHLMAFSVTIPPRTSHERVSYRHEGEEFIYVLSGELDLTVDNEKRRLQKKDSFRFNSNLDHHLSNPGEEETELLVILYIP